MKRNYIWLSIALVICVFLSIGIAGCVSEPAEDVEINVDVAASLTGALTEIADNFMAENPNIKVNLNFAGSSTLKSQILEGADVDMFISANDKNFDPVVEAGLITDKKVLLENKLGIAVLKANPKGITDLGSMTNPGVKLVIGDDAVPFGQYTRIIIQNYENASHAGYVDAFMANVITEVDAVTSIKSYLTLGEADSSIVYMSDISKDDKNDITIIEIPDEYNVIASYPYGIFKATTKLSAVEKFEDYLTGSAGSAVLTDYGFVPVA
ncbi:MAG TPA: molybdate ABC transporter substrate-binding protein [Methanocorpusculum sp.]|nr:molybdate ABC transporter substrate-binding protein [Methanocorpusculum sp.]